MFSKYSVWRCAIELALDVSKDRSRSACVMCFDEVRQDSGDRGGQFRNPKDYGIQIPISKSRSERCFSYLKEKFPGKVKETDCTNLTALSKEDLLLAHNEDFVTSLLGENPDDVLMTCF